MRKLLTAIRECRVCEQHLSLGPRPIVQGHPESKMLIIGQAPGLLVHQTGIPWNDSSGERLRDWLGLSSDFFYDPKRVALLPVGFRYPGRAASGDLPPRKECFDLWHQKFISHLKDVRLTVLVGGYAQKKYLKEKSKKTATENIRYWQEFFPEYLPLPHPSPRNNIWLSKNRWFEAEVLPEVREKVRQIIEASSFSGPRVR